MKQVSQQVSYDDKVVITPVELYRDREVKGECYALFAVMKSFGPFAMAKVGTYGSRLDWSDDRVQKYQKQLQKAGWIVLVREGYDGNPRLWWMCRCKGEQPPQDLVDRVGKKQGVQKTPPVKASPTKKQGVQKTPPKHKKALQSVEVLSNQQKEEREGHSVKPKETSPSQATPQKAENPASRAALNRLSPPWKAKYGFDLSDKNLDLAGRADVLYGDDLDRSWGRYLASSGTRGRLDQERHPLAWFVDQPDSWRTAAAPAGVDPAKVKAHQERLAKQDQERESRQAAVDARREQLEKLWPTLSSVWREHLLASVASLSDFGADVVAGLRTKNGGKDLGPSSWTAETILELWPSFPDLPARPEVNHG